MRRSWNILLIYFLDILKILNKKKFCTEVRTVSNMRSALEDDLLNFFPKISWNDEVLAAIEAKRLLKKLGCEKSVLTHLTIKSLESPHLREMAECHTYDDKIVLFDGLESHGYRIRFRLSKQVEKLRVHNHRFTAIHHILCGCFHQKFYSPLKKVEDLKEFGDFAFSYELKSTHGECFEVNYRDFHTSSTDIGTVSLLLRGPVKNDFAIAIGCEDNRVRMRWGKEKSTSEENLAHRMDDKTFGYWIKKLRQKEIIGEF